MILPVVHSRRFKYLCKCGGFLCSKIINYILPNMHNIHKMISEFKVHSQWKLWNDKLTTKVNQYDSHVTLIVIITNFREL